MPPPIVTLTMPAASPTRPSARTSEDSPATAGVAMGERLTDGRDMKEKMSRVRIRPLDGWTPAGGMSADHRGHILVVEDEPALRAVLAETLVDAGSTVDTAR